jgi:DNA-binding transcriptional ArsR family regulator
VFNASKQVKMGIFDSLVRAFKKRPASPQLAQKPEVSKARAVTKQVRRPRQKNKPPKVEHQMLREWRSEVQKIQEHPLTQAKIINERMLAAVMDLLNEINSKIEELNTRMAQLEERSETRREKSAIKLSTNDQKVLDFIKKKKQAQANSVAEALKISRSNAALKMNKLFSLGLLEKTQDGKDVHYKLA